MKTTTSKVIYGLIFLISFFLFLFLTFPFEVLKETISKKASEMSGLSISMEGLSPNIPLGVHIQGLKLAASDGQSVTLQDVDLDVGLLRILFGKVGISAEIDNGKQGALELDLSLPISGLVSGNVLPSSLNILSERFSLGELISFGLNFYASSPDVNPLLGPMLQQIKVKGRLNSKVELVFDTADLKNSDGSASIKFEGLSLQSTDEALGIPEQKFSVAQFIAKMSGGNFRISDQSKFNSEQLVLGISGVIELKNPISRSRLDLGLPLEMSGAIKDNIGSLIAMLVLKVDDWNGKAKFQISGLMSSPDVKPLLEQ